VVNTAVEVVISISIILPPRLLLTNVVLSITPKPSPIGDGRVIFLLNDAENGHNVMSYSLSIVQLYIHNFVVVWAISLEFRVGVK
jgi:hypothetical protein